MIIYLELLVALIGLVMYLIAKDGKVQEIGRIMFFSGLFAFMLNGGAALISVLHK